MHNTIGVYNCRHLSNTFHVNHGALAKGEHSVIYDGSFTARYSLVPVKDDLTSTTGLYLMLNNSTTTYYSFLASYDPVPTVKLTTENVANIPYAKEFHSEITGERSRLAIRLPSFNNLLRISCIDLASYTYTIDQDNLPKKSTTTVLAQVTHRRLSCFMRAVLSNSWTIYVQQRDSVPDMLAIALLVDFFTANITTFAPDAPCINKP